MRLQAASRYGDCDRLGGSRVILAGTYVNNLGLIAPAGTTLELDGSWSSSQHIERQWGDGRTSECVYHGGDEPGAVHAHGRRGEHHGDNCWTTPRRARSNLNATVTGSWTLNAGA